MSPMVTARFRNPRVRLGYRFNYKDFDRHTRNGYFDPKDFQSHKGVVVIDNSGTDEDHGYERWFYRFEGSLGYQRFERFGDLNSEGIVHLYGTAGVRLTDHISARIFAEYGNFALNTAAGFDYWQGGGGIQYLF